jgi:hypothetical protein
MVVTHGNGCTHGYAISRVERRGGKSVIVLQEDHGLRLAGEQTEDCYFPRRRITGPNRFAIAGRTSSNRAEKYHEGVFGGTNAPPV